MPLSGLFVCFQTAGGIKIIFMGLSLFISLPLRFSLGFFVGGRGKFEENFLCLGLMGLVGWKVGRLVVVSLTVFERFLLEA
jgi:hypothetical protein